MVRGKAHDPFDTLTVSVPLTVALGDGTTARGSLWMHPSRKGRFEVEYKGQRKSDGRSDYMSEAHIRAIAVFILKEMAVAERRLTQ